MKKTKLTEIDYNEFYKTMLYGDLSNPLNNAIKAAYRDVCRTITGFSKNPNHDYILENAKKNIKESIEKLLCSEINTQTDFNKWHKKSSERLIKSFENQNFTYGQAQKWINMTLKYLSMFDHKKVEKIYEYCHIPIDNYILETVRKKGMVSVEFKSAWSRINSYSDYLKFQEEFRENSKEIPLDKEFYMWINSSKVYHN